MRFAPIPKQEIAQVKEWLVFYIGLCYYGICLLVGTNMQSFDSIMNTNLWPTLVVEFGVIICLVVVSHAWLGIPHQIQDYSAITLVAFLAQAVGTIPVLAKRGLTPPFWAIFMGFVCAMLNRLPTRTSLHFGSMVSKPLPLNQEFFIKVGVLLLATDVNSLITLGEHGLVVAWLDTIILMVMMTAFGSLILHFLWTEAIIIVGATCVCGSSAAVAIATSVGISTDAPIVKGVLSIIGIFNIPLIPTMPYMTRWEDDRVVGAWIGGSVDSTGQVIACASISGGGC